MTLAAYEMDSIGVGGSLEAVAAHHFCSPKCRANWCAAAVVPVETGEDNELIDGEVCEQCGKAFLNP